MLKEKKLSYVSAEQGRVDKVSSRILGLSRNVFSKEDTLVFINEKPSKKSSTLKEGDKVEIVYNEDLFDGLEKEDIPLDVLYEDDDILVINKKEGMVVHPGSGVHNGTVANALLSMYGEEFLSSPDETRPGIVHRLDKDTSGVMIIAKNDQAHLSLSQQFANHKNKKIYLAIVKGLVTPGEGEISSRIVRDRNNRKKFTVTENKSEGKDALTKFRVLSQNFDYSLLKIRILTGRTHQIRVHMSSVGHPVLQDPVYSRGDMKYREYAMLLHAYSLTIRHPSTGRKMTFTAPVPDRFLSVMENEGLKFSPDGND